MARDRARQPRQHRSVRVDPALLARLEELARAELVPASFAEQVEAGLRLLIDQAATRQVERSADLLAADADRAEQAYRWLRGDRS